ncbi:hypothetical protein D088_940078 [Salmonella enterica subsp. houtenae serovar 16:z4,z32:-- str. RKS3027]|nr:hypothetical protein D088_940078 [Salmonella enterica subsp. houtenae serovar 16:z4,z32:-- str. RKS3027]
MPEAPGKPRFSDDMITLIRGVYLLPTSKVQAVSASLPRPSFNAMHET